MFELDSLWNKNKQLGEILIQLTEIQLELNDRVACLDKELSDLKNNFIFSSNSKKGDLYV